MVTRVCIVALGIAALSAGAVEARSFAAGWYVIEEDPHGTVVKSGPFFSEGDCRHALPSRRDPDGEVHCVDLKSRPGWWRD